MKKSLIFTVTLALAAALVLPAMAAEPLVSPAPDALISAQTSGTYQITVDGEDIDADACVLVPVRAVAESLGFSVTWNADRTVTLDDGVMHTTITPGKDSYFVVTSNPDLVGMSAPFSLGAPPVVIHGTTYVPAGLFEALLGNEEGALSVNGGTISFQSADDTEIANPFQEHDSLASLEKAVGFSVSMPEAPQGYTLESIQDISGELAQLTFRSGTQSITYRVAKGSADVSGVYETFASDKTDSMNGISVRCRGNGQEIQLATWTADGMSYSIYAPDGLSCTQVQAMVG